MNYDAELEQKLPVGRLEVDEKGAALGTEPMAPNWGTVFETFCAAPGKPNPAPDGGRPEPGATFPGAECCSKI